MNKQKINVYKGKNPPRTETTNSLIGRTFNLNNIKYIN